MLSFLGTVVGEYVSLINGNSTVSTLKVALKGA